MIVLNIEPFSAQRMTSRQSFDSPGDSLCNPTTTPLDTFEHTGSEDNGIAKSHRGDCLLRESFAPASKKLPISEHIAADVA